MRRAAIEDEGPSTYNNTECVCDRPIPEPGIDSGRLSCALCGKALRADDAANLAGRCRHCAYKEQED